MPILNRAAELQDEVADWRREIHENPELMFDLFKTSELVQDKLKSFGLDEVVPGFAKTGVVGIIKGNLGNGPTVGLRADMDALPIDEITGKDWASKTPDVMHACGHDGHTAMLLGAAKYLAETRNFAGSVAVIFQPAEEGGGGGNIMVKEGMMEKFNIEKVFGMHNMPGLPVGEFATRAGPLMAATVEFTVTLKGRGGHAAQPNKTIDPIVMGSQVVSAMQSIVSRSTNPVDSLVVSVTKFIAGTAYNIIPEEALIAGTCRYLNKEVGEMAVERLTEIANSVAAAHGGTADVKIDWNYPVTVNHEAETAFAADVASDIAGDNKVERNVLPVLGGEDFSYMLEARPGSFIFIGNGDTAGLHHPAYDFNDEVIPHGISYWVKLAETALAPA